MFSSLRIYLIVQSMLLAQSSGTANNLSNTSYISLPNICNQINPGFVNFLATICLTDGGEDPGKPCVFPFEFGGKSFDQCTWQRAGDDKAWCSTQVDSHGVLIIGKWGHCGAQCPITRDDRCSSRAVKVLTQGIIYSVKIMS
jgi:hypothetical protein